MIGLVVPVMNNFKGFTELMASLNEPVLPIVEDNWTENRGVSKAWNQGILWAIESGCSHVMVANDDVLFEGVEPLRKMAEVMDASGIDLLTPTNVRDGFVPDEGLTPYPDFAAFMIRPAEFVEKFGTFDETFSPAYFEDNDMARRILVGGGTYANHLGIGFLHKGSVTQNMDPANPVVPHQRFDRNRDYYIGKWGGMPMEEKYTAPFNGLTGKTYKDW